MKSWSLVLLICSHIWLYMILSYYILSYIQYITFICPSRLCLCKLGLAPNCQETYMVTYSYRKVEKRLSVCTLCSNSLLVKLSTVENDKTFTMKITMFLFFRFADYRKLWSLGLLIIGNCNIYKSSRRLWGMLISLI